MKKCKMSSSVKGRRRDVLLDHYNSLLLKHWESLWRVQLQVNVQFPIVELIIVLMQKSPLIIQFLFQLLHVFLTFFVFLQAQNEAAVLFCCQLDQVSYFFYKQRISAALIIIIW